MNVFKYLEKSSCCMLIWSGKNYGYGQGKSGNLILHKEWEPCCIFSRNGTLLYVFNLFVTFLPFGDLSVVVGLALDVVD